MKKALIMMAIGLITLTVIVKSNEVIDEIKKSKEHHETYHELIKENYRLNEWYQNHDCYGSYEPCSVSVECDKFEL